MIDKDHEGQSSPIIIIGSPRSGTSILIKAIKAALGVSGYAEGHFLPLIMMVMKAVEDYYGQRKELTNRKSRAVSHIDRDNLEEDILALFRKQYESIMPSDTWIDKTPGVAMIQASPYILRTWPKSRFIFAKRRGIECIASRLRKFPDVPFEKHCHLWKSSMETWLDVRDSLKSCYVEIEQREISLQPVSVAEKLGKFLDLDSNQVEKLQHIFLTERPQFTGSVEEDKAISISETGWTDEQIKIFRKYCGVVSEKYGYSESSSYHISNIIN